MSTNPIEVNYQIGRTIYCFRSNNFSATPQFFNTITNLYENYNSANWAKYAISIPEVSPGYYRVMPPVASLSSPATELIYEVRDTGVGAQISDAPSIGNSNSQGVNLASVQGVQSSVAPQNPVTDTYIINLALTHLGQRQINSISDETENARRASLFFSNARDSVLRACSWNFAAVIAALVELPNETVVGWQSVYELPQDAVFVRKVFDQDGSVFDLPIFNMWPPDFIIPQTNPKTQQFRIFYQPDIGAMVIATNFNPAYIEYTTRMTDSSQFDQLFTEALALKLASLLAPVLNASQDTKTKIAQDYMIKISEAMKVNGQEDPTPNRERSAYLDAR